jgi:oxaloacetate decarboxylase
MKFLRRRKELRACLSGERCIFPASVFDPISARIAQDIGYELAMFAGSVASFTVLGAPDKVVLTLTELAEQARRICRASSIPLIVDADHGFGNALNVRRTVEELETAGVSGLTIEDTELPQGFGKPAKALIAVDEVMGKFQAALDARQDPSLCIFARSTAFNALSTQEALARIACYVTKPVDGLFLVGIKSWEQLEGVKRLTELPILLGSSPEHMKDAKRLAELSVRVALEGHGTFTAAVRATYESLLKMRLRVDPAAALRAVPDDLIASVTREADYKDWTRQYLGTD